jgi:hypothetical protein
MEKEKFEKVSLVDGHAHLEEFGQVKKIKTFHYSSTNYGKCFRAFPNSLP